jgi:hypothetical protein
MRAIDKFILHIVHNWTNELNEAYSEAAVKDFIKHFQQQADRLNTEIPDEATLRRYIANFDKIKDKLPADKRDLKQYALPDFIAKGTSIKDKNTPKREIDITPDVVFPKPGDPIPSEGEPGYDIVIYNGSTEKNCVKYGKGEKWCITRTSFPTYRGSEDRSYPTFYLARNNNPNIPAELSFVAIQVRNPKRTTPANRYVYTNRENRPNESRPMSFSELLSEIPWLDSIPNIESILKYIDLSEEETAIYKYGGNAIPISDWLSLESEAKQGYLIARKNKELFSDISGNDFVREYLPEYPELALYIAKNYGILSPIDLLRNLDKFNKEGDKISLIRNLQEKVNLNQLEKSTIPFNVKQLLVKYDRWNTPLNIRLYNTEFNNNPAIAELELDDDGIIDVNLYLRIKKYSNIKDKTEYIANYPQLDKLPFKNLMWAATNGIINRNKLESTLETAKNDPSSSLIIQDKENGKLVLDANSYTVYDLEGESVVKVPEDDEVAQGLINTAKTNPAFQENTVNIVKQSIGNNKNLPNIDREAFTSTIEATPYDKRIIQGQENQYIVLKPENEPDDTRYALFARNISNKTELIADHTFGNSRTWREFDTRNSMSQSMWAAYFKYLRSINQPYTDGELLEIMRGYDNGPKRTFIRANPPLVPNSRYAVAYYNDAYYLIDKTNPRESKRLSDRRDTLNKTTVPPELLRRVLGQQATPTPRPAAPAAQAAPAAPAAPAAQAGNDTARLIAAAGLTAGFATLPTSVQQRIQAGTAANPRFERTARSRDAELGARGNVTGVIVSGQSKMVIIQLASGAIIAQISIQPEARHYIVTSTTSFDMGRVGNFINSLAQRNISEAVRGYIDQNPDHRNNVYEILKYINETKK